MNIRTFIIFLLLQICFAQFGGVGAAVDVSAFGATKKAVGAAKAKAAGGKSADGFAQVIAKDGFVKATSAASASSKKYKKPPKKYGY